MVLALVDTLVDLHAVDPAAVGLADFGRPDGFLERQVRRWGKQLDGLPQPATCRASTSCSAALAASLPDSGPPTVVHGDYRLDNVLVGTRRPGPRGARLGDVHPRRPADRPRRCC